MAFRPPAPAAAALMLVLLAGCGGGGSDSAVSPSPTAPSPPAGSTPDPDGTTPSPAPTTPSPTPAPAPEPEPSPVSPPAAPAPDSSSISGAVLATALATVSSAEGDNAAAIGDRAGPPATRAYVNQQVYATPSGQYIHGSGSYGSFDLGQLVIVTDWARNKADVELGSTVRGTVFAQPNTTLQRTEPFRVDPAATYALDQAIAEWRPQSAADPWFAQLMLQSDGAGETVFRICWHVRLPQMVRLACKKHDRVTGEARGIYLVDDSDGLGPKIWETR